ncbi:MAG: DUF262 domain-containing protein [Bacteroidota bacterium]|nr:DUF262 domain-containing protein [Bacteroidota bacterium]
MNVDLSPHYQRRNRWDIERQSLLIESFLMNVPVPPVFLNEDEYGKYSVIDGKQRITTIKMFLNNKLTLTGLTVFAELNGKKYKDFPLPLQNVIIIRPNLRAVIILRQSDKDIKHEVFQRLNTGGMALNPQEIRNNAFPGKLNDLMMELSQHELFHDVLGIKNKEKSRIYKEMRDVEFVLKYFALKKNMDNYNGNMKLFLDDFMDYNRNPSDIKIKEYKKSFIDAVNKVNTTFGIYAFRRWQPEKSAWRRQVLAALFDSEMLALEKFSYKELEDNRELIVQEFQKLFEDGTQFRYAIDSATNNPGPSDCLKTSLLTILLNLLTIRYLSLK